MVAGDSRCARRRGVTLIEFVMVAVVMGILAALIVPFVGSTDSFGLPYAAQMLTADFEFAQSEAIRTQRNIRVDVNVGNETYDVYFVDSGDRLTHPFTGENMTIDIRNLAENDGIDIVTADLNDGSNSFVFSPTGEPVGVTDGEPVSGPRSIILDLEGERVLIELVPIVGTTRITNL